ncbi:coenzyme F420-0:L-glutamate ligase [Marinibaculum pumilum]|uniref:Coenzyme F420-0:L-glutamate ligase n=1 Tax=Marinibaculum pumilum TaxID=1766165 RepID=A0ABV7KTX0_9PROT
MDAEDGRTAGGGDALAGAGGLYFLPLLGLGRIGPGDDLAGLLAAAAAADPAIGGLQAGDVLVLAQKIVSKAEGRLRRLAEVVPSAEALRLATGIGKDPRLVELILSEAEAVVATAPGVLVVRHRLGLVLANAGIDRSNTGAGAEGTAEEAVLLLPEDPDRSARELRAALSDRLGHAPAVMIVDSLGRAWRNGTCGTAIGSAGLAVIHDRRGAPDLFGRPLMTTQIAIADEIAAGASLAMGGADEGRPAVILRGLSPALLCEEGGAGDLVRPAAGDLFRSGRRDAG